MTRKLSPAQDLHKILKAFIKRHQFDCDDGLGPSKCVEMLDRQRDEILTISLSSSGVERLDGAIQISGTLGAGFTIHKDGEVVMWNDRQN